MGKLKAYFLAGILITAPVGITFYIAWIFVAAVDRGVTSLLPEIYNPQNYLPFGIPGIGLLIAIMVLTLVGAITAGFLGRLIVKINDNILERMPIISGIYGAVKQILETVLARKSQAFRQVVLIEYPRIGIWTIAFVVGKTIDEIEKNCGNEILNVFVPTTPNPTSGFLLFISARDVRPLSMSVEDGLKFVISSGIVTPVTEG